VRNMEKEKRLSDFREFFNFNTFCVFNQPWQRLVTDMLKVKEKLLSLDVGTFVPVQLDNSRKWMIYGGVEGSEPSRMVASFVEIPENYRGESTRFNVWRSGVVYILFCDGDIGLSHLHRKMERFDPDIKGYDTVKALADLSLG